MTKSMACLLALGALAAACSDTFDDIAIVFVDAGADGGADATTSDASVDAAIDANGDASDASDAGGPPRLLLSYNGMTSSELVAMNVATGQVDGRLSYPGFIGTTWTGAPDPYLLEQANDLVVRLDRGRPWVPRASWNVTLSDRADGGSPYADPVAVVVGAGTKAYVLRYTRNQIAVIDMSQTADAGAPLGTIDLGGLVQPHDRDGLVEQTAAVYVPSRRLVYVLLGNIDKTNVSTDGFTLLCAQTTATVVAIDVDTDKLVKLAEGDATGAIRLAGYNPLFGGGFAYDDANDRLVLMHAGCNQSADGGTGPLVGRIVEEVSLFTGTTRRLLDANGRGFPSAFVFLDPRRAVVQFDFAGSSTFVWDPSQPTLGPAIPNAPDSFVYDGRGNLVGVTSTYGDGGVTTRIDVTQVRIADGNVKKLASDPFVLTGGFVAGVDLWPRP